MNNDREYLLELKSVEESCMWLDFLNRSIKSEVDLKGNNTSEIPHSNISFSTQTKS